MTKKICSRGAMTVAACLPNYRLRCSRSAGLLYHLSKLRCRPAGYESPKTRCLPWSAGMSTWMRSHRSQVKTFRAQGVGLHRAGQALGRRTTLPTQRSPPSNVALAEAFSVGRRKERATRIETRMSCCGKHSGSRSSVCIALNREGAAVNCFKSAIRITNPIARHRNPRRSACFLRTRQSEPAMRSSHHGNPQMEGSPPLLLHRHHRRRLRQLNPFRWQPGWHRLPSVTTQTRQLPPQPLLHRRGP